MNPISMKFDIELGANIFSVGEGNNSVYLSSPVTSYLQNKVIGSAFDNASGRAVEDIRTATIHTHSRAGAGGISEAFSGGALRNKDVWNGRYALEDLGSAVVNGINSYIATPGGTLQKFSFEAYLKDWKNQRPLNSYTTTIRTNIRTWKP